jgi:hypothetical protein
MLEFLPLSLDIVLTCAAPWVQSTSTSLFDPLAQDSVSLEHLELVAQPRGSTYALPTAGLDRIYSLKTPLCHATVEGRLQLRYT